MDLYILFKVIDQSVINIMHIFKAAKMWIYLKAWNRSKRQFSSQYHTSQPPIGVSFSCNERQGKLSTPCLFLLTQRLRYTVPTSNLHVKGSANKQQEYNMISYQSAELVLTAVVSFQPAVCANLKARQTVFAKHRRALFLP